MNLIVTGAGGFIGQELAAALLADNRVTKLILTDVMEPSLSSDVVKDGKVEIQCAKADLTSAEECSKLFTSDLDVVYLLHGIMSGAAEANLELGLKVNLDSTRTILDIMRKVKPGVKVIFPSSLAVYGAPGPQEVVSENTIPLPGSSYGSQKLICETLLNDFSRRGLLDGRICRLPTVVVRPGAPSGAASSFASGIIREPLKGIKSALPVSKGLEMWVSSPQTVVRNLVLAMDIPKEDYGAGSRTVNLPGITVTVEEMLAALKTVGGQKAVDLVEERRDPAVEKIVGSWPARFNTEKAKKLGFVDDGSLVQTIEIYVKQYGS
ncbi:putative nucleoside-diphosphate-sugar epimerase [Coleophoma cylindrospora]|uniref:Putative nucleoside-diphosphate-sugar epimerase n=1 Tax=Coleophoma cylindrospora TaxID=1849047 RepID=A0A3D8QBA5_9HELO|nr:putative nucleoside-diphosphate-sugar epimerase [Coleophoma cylindrospora]